MAGDPLLRTQIQEQQSGQYVGTTYAKAEEQAIEMARTLKRDVPIYRSYRGKYRADKPYWTAQQYHNCIAAPDEEKPNG